MQLDDLADFSAEWVEPISIDYRGWRIYELPPNVQGMAALEMLNIMSTFQPDSGGPQNTVELHKKIEAMKLAYADLYRYNADPKFAKVPVQGLLSKAYAAQRAALINPNKANCNPGAGTPAYRVRDPAEWSFYGPKAEDILRVEVTSAMVRSLGEMGVDRVLSDGRKSLIATAARRAQAGLDAAHSGLELSSLELTRLAPPLALAADFDEVQSAFIGAETKKKDAQAFAETVIPQAQAQANNQTQVARGTAESDLALARGAAGAFRALDREYRANQVVVRERLYRDAVERAIGNAGKVRWVPPPVGGKYQGFRITVQQAGAGPLQSPTGNPAGGQPDDDERLR